MTTTVTVPSSPSRTGRALGAWLGDASSLRAGPAGLVAALQDINQLVSVVQGPQGPAAATGGEARLGAVTGGLPLLAVVPPMTPETLGDPGFLRAHGLRYPYVGGAMANGIASAEMVIALGKAGMLGSFGAAGLSLDRVEQAIDRIQAELGDKPACYNLIHSPGEPGHEQRTVDLFLRKHVRLVEASAYLGLTPMLVQYRATGLQRSPDGSVLARNRVIAKVSRAEVATAFMKPAPEDVLQALVAAGKLSAAEAALAKEISIADDVTVEADSGGHTDNRALVALLPIILNLRDRLGTRGTQGHLVRVGAAGGIATPAATAAAFAMGAAYVLTGSINQACRESGLSPRGRALLVQAEMADVMMAPAADMFEMGVKVQVLKRGTMFAMRAQKLYELYRTHDSLEAIPAAEMQRLEQQLFRRPMAEVWADTQTYWQKMDPKQLERAASSPKVKMALCFRWYLGLASRWAIQGDESRALDFQVWCGPAQGAFNEWARGSCLEKVESRDVVTLAHNLMDGACVVLRAQALRGQGVSVPESAFRFAPRAYPA